MGVNGYSSLYACLFLLFYVCSKSGRPPSNPKQLYQQLKLRMNRYISLLLLLALLPTVFPSDPLSLELQLQIQLSPSSPKEYLITPNHSTTYSQDLFIYASPTYADPFEVPYLSISSEGGYLQYCYNANSEFAGICRITAQDLNSHSNFLLSIKCLTACSLDLQTELGKVVKLDVGESIELRAHEQAITEVVHLIVPDEEFSSLAVMAVVLNQEESLEVGEEGVSVLLNYGADIQDPTEAQFQLRAGSLNGGGKGAFIHRDKISPGQTIKAEVRLKPGIHVRFGVAALSGNEFSIEMGRPYYDYTDKEPKIYSLDASFLTADKALQIVIDVYSGSPEFAVSFTHDFAEVVEFTRKSSAVSILVSPQVRQKYGFKGTVFIRASSGSTSEYYFYTQLIRDDATFIQPYLTYFDQLPKDKVENYLLFERYKFPIDSPQQRNFSFKVETFKGKGSFYFKRCPSLESQQDPSFGDCLFTHSSQLKQAKFYEQQIQNKHVISGNMLTVFMSYDVALCTHLSTANGLVSVLCAFQIIALAESEQPFEFSLLSERKYLSSYIREGRIVKEYIPRGNYVYFAFALPDPNAVEEINVFLTTLSGDAALIISKQQKLPDLSSNATKQSGSKCNIVLSGEGLGSEIYISVYAYQFTQVNLGVIVHRKATPGNSHRIPLQRGNIQNYILNKTQNTATFLISSTAKGEITVVINELLGAVRMKVLTQDGQQQKCTNVPQDRLFCKFAAEEGRNYSVQVSSQSEEARISISYRTSDTECFAGCLNHPVYISLPGEQRSCYTFSINREVPLLFASSLTHIQTLERQIKISLYLNDALYTTITSAHLLITVHNMIEICEMGLKSDSFPKSCRLSLAFDNSAPTANDFSFILEETDGDMALLDGVSEKVREIQAGQGRHFYYHVKSSKLMQLFFSTQSLKSHYFLAARFASNEEFLARNEQESSIYPKQVFERDRTPGRIDSRDNYYQAMLGLTGLEVISIDTAAINKYCPTLDCFLLVSVYPQTYESNIVSEDDSYEIEVTQQETVLPLGESRIGVVNKGDVYTYIVSPNDAILQFRLVNAGSAGKMCLKVQGALANGSIVKGNELSRDMQVTRSELIERVFVVGEEDGCSYEISYISNDHPYRVVRLSHPYELSLSSGQIERFIYYHQNPRTFKIAPLVSAGSLKAYIMPVRSEEMNLLALSKLQLSQYPLFSSDNGEYTMRENDPNFCSKCFYYILVTTESRFVGQVVFLRLYDPVPLSANHAFKEHLLPLTALGVENYVYYSLTSFNITFNMFAGEMELVITDPLGRAVVSEDVTRTSTYSFAPIEYAEKEKIEYYSERAKYKIRVAVIKEAEFYVEVKRAVAAERLFEGFPSKVQLAKDKTQTVEFVNSQDLQQPLSLMVDIEEEGSSPALLTFTLRGEGKDGKALDSSKLMSNMTKSDNTYILSLLNFEGRYFLDIYSFTDVKATLLLVKERLTHLSPRQNYLFNSPGVYQVYSNYNKVLIEVFNCQGELHLIGSRDERDMSLNLTTSTSPIKLNRPNYGGHYVYNVEMVFASYFMRVSSRAQDQPLEYLVNYYYYKEVNPYEAIDAASYDITVEKGEAGINLRVAVPKVQEGREGVKDSGIRIESIVFTAYAALDRLALNRFSRCNIEGRAQKTSANASSILLDKSFLSKLGVDNDTKQFFATVQASVTISVSHSSEQVGSNFPRTLTFLYNSLEIALQESVTIVQSYAYWFTDSWAVFVGWMVLPFVLALATLYYLLTYCLRRLMMRQADMVEEVEIVPSNQTVPTEQKIAESGTVPETGTQMIKEHI